MTKVKEGKKKGKGEELDSKKNEKRVEDVFEGGESK